MKNGKWIEREDNPKSLAYAEQTDKYEFTIKSAEWASSINNKLWLVVKGVENKDGENGYIIKPNDILKIGRVALRVRELVTANWQAFESIDEEFEDVATLEEEPKNEELCKFWWTGEETEDNPKMCPCSCTGSMRYIHFKCLRHWIDSRKQVKSERGITSVMWKSFDWEICKKPYPTLFKYKGK